MPQIRSLVHALALLIVVGLVSTAMPTNAAQNDLIEAASAGDVARIKALLTAKADVNSTAANGATALISASQNGHLDAVRALLTAKADVNAKAANGVTALIVASGMGHLGVVQTLLTAKADVAAQADNGGTALLAASDQGYRDVVLALLSAKADVNARTLDGRTALIVASGKGYLTVVSALLAAKADVNATDEAGEDAFMLAWRNDQPDTARLLKKAGASAVAPGCILLSLNHTGGVPVIIRTKGVPDPTIYHEGDTVAVFWRSSQRQNEYEMKKCHDGFWIDDAN